ncbi:MAG: prolipoprotein diacylglyceryl transferase [Bryobacterales bacterium]|nr:prolipoprotein diacylglyceryl transferase [Bryobacterales bacterium]
MATPRLNYKASKLIPYFELSAIKLGPIRVAAQPLFGAIGILVAHFLYLRRTRHWKLDTQLAGWLSFTMVFVGLVGAFLFRWVYLANALRRDPWIWLKTTQGAASFGGIAAGLLAAVLFLRIRRVPGDLAWRYLDALASVFPFGWIFGRIGCSLIHDHPGLRSGSWLAVRYPDAPRWDLAVVEVLFFAILVIPLFVWLARRPRPAGFLLGLFLTLYGGFRVLLDRLHVDPPGYFGISVDQLAYGTACLIGVVILSRAIRHA